MNFVVGADVEAAGDGGLAAVGVGVGVAETGNNQPFTGIPHATEDVEIVDVLVTHVDEISVAYSMTWPTLIAELHSWVSPAPKKPTIV